MKKFYTLTALLLSSSPSLRGEGDDLPKLTEREWEEKRAAALANINQTELVKMVVAAEVKNRNLEKTQLPKNARVLTEEEGKAYDAYVALGKPDELKTKVEDGEKASTSLAERERADAVKTAAEHSQFKPSVLGDRLKADGLTVVPSREVERDGKKAQVAYVKDAQNVEHELSEYAKKHWEDYIPALTVTPSTEKTGGQEFVKQDASNTGSGGSGSWVKDALAKSSTGGGYTDPLQAGSAPAAAK